MFVSGLQERFSVENWTLNPETLKPFLNNIFET